MSLELYWSSKCNGCSQLFVYFKKYPQLKKFFQFINIDKYVQAKRQYPRGIRGTPTVLRKDNGRIQAYEGKKIFELFKAILANENQQKYAEQRAREQARQRYQEADIDIEDDKTPFEGKDTDQFKYRRGAFWNPDEETPDWAMGMDGQRNPDPKQFQISDSKDSKYSMDLKSAMKQFENQRGKVDATIKTKIKGQKRPKTMKTSDL